MNRQLGTLYGRDVLLSTIPLRRPKLKLSATLPVSDRCRTEMNAWLLDLFGEEHYAIWTNSFIVIDEETFRELKREVQNFAFCSGDKDFLHPEADGRRYQIKQIENAFGLPAIAKTGGA
jgi:hypothetical protein